MNDDNEFIEIDGQIVNREEYFIREAMRALGKRTSERKKLSSRLNAKRPRKKSKRLAKPMPNGQDHEK
jgi:hypothetical protein